MDPNRFSTVNLNDPEPWANRRSVLLGLPIAFLIAAWISVAGRLYTRIFIVRSPGLDDLFCVLYALMTLVGTVALCVSTEYGLGQHFLLLSFNTMGNYLRLFYVANASYTSSTAFIKLALMFQYLRVFDRGTVMHRICIFVTVFTALWGFAYMFIAWVPCFPVQAAWDIFTQARCYGFASRDSWELMVTFESHTAINMVLDAIILLIPMQLFWKADTSLAQRLRLLALIVLGSLVIVFAAWRFVTIIEHQAATYPTQDPTWYGPISILLAVLEADTAAICASVPIFWPKLSEHWGKIFVTQEVKITRETRYLDEDESVLTGGNHSRNGSEAELKRTDSTRRAGAASAGASHYQDSYILQQVDPLRTPQELARVEAKMSNDNIRAHAKWTKL